MTTAARRQLPCSTAEPTPLDSASPATPTSTPPMPYRRGTLAPRSATTAPRRRPSPSAPPTVSPFAPLATTTPTPPSAPHPTRVPLSRAFLEASPQLSSLRPGVSISHPRSTNLASPPNLPLLMTGSLLMRRRPSIRRSKSCMSHAPRGIRVRRRRVGRGDKRSYGN